MQPPSRWTARRPRLRARLGGRGRTPQQRPSHSPTSRSPTRSARGQTQPPLPGLLGLAGVKSPQHDRRPAGTTASQPPDATRMRHRGAGTPRNREEARRTGSEGATEGFRSRERKTRYCEESRGMRPTGVEPATFGLKDRRSLAPRKEPLTTELRALVSNLTRASCSEHFRRR
jgi:hypothetical protein